MLFDFAETPNHLRHSSGILEPANRGDSRSARRHTVARICGRDSTDGHYRNRNAGTNLSQLLQPLRRTERRLGRRGIYRPEDQIIRASLLRCPCSFERMRRNSYQKISAEMFLGDKPIRLIYRHAALTEMHTTRAHGNRYIQAVIHQHATRPRNAAQGFPDQSPQFAPRKVLLANLNPVDTRPPGILYFLQKYAKLFFNRPRQTLSIRHVTKFHLRNWKAGRCALEPVAS